VPIFHGGVSFNGSSNINLPGVNSAGNQNISGNAGTTTTLQLILLGGVFLVYVSTGRREGFKGKKIGPTLNGSWESSCIVPEIDKDKMELKAHCKNTNNRYPRAKSIIKHVLTTL